MQRKETQTNTGKRNRKTLRENTSAGDRDIAGDYEGSVTNTNCWPKRRSGL